MKIRNNADYKHNFIRGLKQSKKLGDGFEDPVEKGGLEKLVQYVKTNKKFDLKDKV